jgi:hypothetical protein
VDADAGKPTPDQVKIAAELADVYRLRGEFVSYVAAFDLALDRIVAWHFGVREQEGDFRSWVLKRFSFNDKIQIARDIVRSLGLEDVLGQVVTELHAVNERRNQIAHSTITAHSDPRVMTPPFEEGKLDGWYSVARSRSGMQEVRVEVDTLRGWNKSARERLADMERLFLGVASARRGEDSEKTRAILRRFDEALSKGTVMDYEQVLREGESDAPDTSNPRQ